MEKGIKGQITIFIIVAVIFIGIILTFFIFHSSDTLSFNFLSFEEQVSVVHESIKECLTLVYSQELDSLGKQGGYYYEPLTPYIDAGLYNIPFYYLDELGYVPDTLLMEEELANAVEFKEIECFDLITEKEIEYDFRRFATNVTIKDATVEFIFDTLLTFKKGENTIEVNFKNEPMILNSNIKEMNSFASYMAYSHDINNGSLCVTCFTDIAYGKELGVSFSTEEFDSVLLVSITETRIEYHPQTYSFALSEFSQFSESDKSNYQVHDSLPQLSPNEEIAPAPQI